MKRIIEFKAQLILTICADVEEPLSAIDLSDEIIDYSLENNYFDPFGNFLHRYFDIALSPWLTLTMSPAFLTNSLEELVMCGRLVEHGSFPNQRYSITARGRRTMRVVDKWKTRVKARASKIQTA